MITRVSVVQVRSAHRLARQSLILTKQLLEQLFGPLRALLAQQHGFVLVLRVADEALLVQAVEGVPVEARYRNSGPSRVAVSQRSARTASSILSVS